MRKKNYLKIDIRLCWKIFDKKIVQKVWTEDMSQNLWVFLKKSWELLIEENGDVISDFMSDWHKNAPTAKLWGSGKHIACYLLMDISQCYLELFSQMLDLNCNQ